MENKIYKFISVNSIFTLFGLIYYYIYYKQWMIILYLYSICYNVLFVNAIDYFTKDNVNISKKSKYVPTTIKYLLDISKVSAIECISIFICNKRVSHNISYELLTFIPKTFIFEIIFDFFHYWIHRISHYKYLYYFHKKHHHHTYNISVFSTYQHSVVDLLCSNVVPMYLTSLIIPLSVPQFFIFLLCKTFIEISGHSGTHIKNSAFIQCIWIPRLFGIELYSKDHYIHHAIFNYNYGKRFTIWDKVFGTYKKDDKIEKEEGEFFDKKITIISNKYMRFGLLTILLGVGYLL